jgi:tetratricopeptide (TPR) repeat protein
MQQGVTRLARTTGRPLALRVGMSAGEVVAEDDDFFGDPVGEAARLCARAEAGQVLVASLVRAMAGRRAVQAFSPVGDLELKGLPEPVPTLDMSWEIVTSDGPRIPLSVRLAGGGPGFFGRRDERQELSSALGEALAGRRQVVLIGGEPGIGKTALTSVVAREAHERGWTVLYGRCEEDLGVPYQPFLEALTTYVDQGPADVLQDHIEAHGGELARMVPTLLRRMPGCPAPRSSDPDTERYLTVGAATGLLALASRHAPLLIALDDLHWADRPTLQLLRHVADSTEYGQLVVVGTYRTSDLGRGHPLGDTLAALRRERGVSRLELTGLSVDDVVALIESAAGEPLDEAHSGLAVALSKDTGGNPFFVWTMLRHLVESGALTQSAAGHWSADEAMVRSGLPKSIHEVVGQRVRRLGPATEHVLGLASVIGRDFDAGVLGEVAGISEDEALDSLESAVSATLVAETGEAPGTFTFNHSLIQYTLYDRLGRARQRRAHHRVAEVLEQRHGDSPGQAGALAHHWLEAGDEERALRYCIRAGQVALESLAPDEAVRWFDQALVLQGSNRPDAGAERVDLLVALGTAKRLVGDTGFRDTLLEAGELAAALDDPERMARAALANNRGYYSALGRADVGRIAALEAALGRLDDADSSWRALLLATLATEVTFSTDFDSRVALMREAKGMAERLGDPATMLNVMNLIVETVRAPSNLDERLADTALGVELAAEVGDPAASFWAVGHRMRAAFEAGLLVESRALFDEMSALAQEIGQPVMRWMATYAAAQWALLDGDIAEGERLAAEAFALGTESGQPDAAPYFGGAMNHAMWQRGTSGDALVQLEASAVDNPGVPAFYASVARAAAQCGRHDRAQELLDAAVAVKFQNIPSDLLWTSAIVTYAETAIVLDDVSAAAVLYETLEPWPDQMAYMGIRAEGPIAHYLGALATMLGRYDDADRHFATALDLDTRVPAPFHLARTRLEHGRMLVARGRDGDVEAAVADFTRARAVAVERGYGEVARRAEAALGALDVD